ncbi:PE-PPE domain-containing protein [Corynebacterium callunae]|uniref:hypothetical protein n=1 Tax=Corynebacterium callunae TaxID=1721 RepID=UPI003982835F
MSTAAQSQVPSTYAIYLQKLADPQDSSEILIHPDKDQDLYQDVFDPPQNGECPAVVAIAARGSEQNSKIRPTRYHPESPWTSNGFEAENIRAFFARLEQYHLETTGTSIMKNVYVLGLEDEGYPASMPLDRPGSTALEFSKSLSSGRASVISTIDQFESETGCRSQYLLVGYSQGSLVIEGQEAELTKRGQFVGSLYIANPALQPGDPSVVGHQPIRGGLISSSNATPENEKRINYCLPQDLVCDRAINNFVETGSSMAQSLFNTGIALDSWEHLKYFIQEKPWDEEVFVKVGSWISESETKT